MLTTSALFANSNPFLKPISTLPLDDGVELKGDGDLDEQIGFPVAAVMKAVKWVVVGQLSEGFAPSTPGGSCWN